MDEKQIVVNRLEHGIYEFVSLGASRSSVDAFFLALSEAMKEQPPEKTFRYVVNLSNNELPPLAYFIGKNRAWVAANPGISPTRAAVLLPINNPLRAFIVTLMPVVMRAARSPLKLALYEPKDREKALEWLLADS